jgi:glycosyltransferase involved in cell wall biosynthesis
MSDDHDPEPTTAGNSSPTVSVVMPAYNCERYVDAALKSLSRQTLREWECICVDDGSTDDTASRLDHWAAREQRIRGVHQSNAGPSAARNRGLDLARGTFLFFLDADDIIHPEALQRLVGVARAEHADVVIGGVSMIAPDCETLGTELAAAPVTAYEAPILPHLLSYRTLRFKAWGKLYARACVASARFPVGVHCAEDTFFTLSAAAAARRVVVCPDPLYGYRRVPTSLSKNRESGRKYVAGSTAVALHCHDLCAAHKVDERVADRLMTEVMSAAADSAVAPADYDRLRAEVVAGILKIYERTGRRRQIISPQHLATWLFTATMPSRVAPAVLSWLRNFRRTTVGCSR